MQQWEVQFQNKIREVATVSDPAHDFLHFQRVVYLAKDLCEKEGGLQEVVVPAAWLHDLVIVPKDSPLRSQASRMSAEAAVEFLKSIEYPSRFLDPIAHAVEGHSFSANIEVTTLEAKIVQDADRLDGLGAIGVARCFATAGLMGRAFYSEDDAFCKAREPDDSRYTVDHFYKKLFKVAESLKTKAGLAEGQRRVKVMHAFLQSLNQEISH